MCYRVHPQRGVCIFSKKRLRQARRVHELVGVLGRKVSRERAGRSFFSAIRVHEKRYTVHRLVFGPVALVNHACRLHANCKEVDQWRGLEVLEEDIDAGQELLACYGDDIDLMGPKGRSPPHLAQLGA